MDKATLDALAEGGFLTARPNGDLTLYNYTPMTVWAKAWDENTLAARGLVLASDGRVVARPFPKFFNLGERPETQPEALPADVPELADKHDGSLIVCFFDGESWRCVTRGSWDNQQAVWANQWIASRCAGFDRTFTYLFELVAPWNRIVLSYEREDMVLLGRVHTESGLDATYAETAAHALSIGLTPTKFESKPLAGLDMTADVRNAEGFVARFANGFRVKLKYGEYMRLHKLITGLSVKAIWEGLAAGNDRPPECVPDEFLEWWRKHAGLLTGEFARIEANAREAFAAVGQRETRKDYAFAFLERGDLAPILFSMLDKRDYAPAIWKRIKPFGNQVFKTDEA